MSHLPEVCLLRTNFHLLNLSGVVSVDLFVTRRAAKTARSAFRRCPWSVADVSPSVSDFLARALSWPVEVARPAGRDFPVALTGGEQRRRRIHLGDTVGDSLYVGVDRRFDGEVSVVGL